MKKLGTIPLGIALFTMFFGAGNIVFPLILGREVQGNIFPALMGFIVTGVAVPIIGFIATMLYQGDYEKFFATIGKIPAKATIFICMIIAGLLASSRCVIISYASVQQYIPWCSIFTYSLIVGVIIFILTFKENMVVKILGRVLGPIKITLLFAILFLVIFYLKPIAPSKHHPIKSFLDGLGNGYLSLDMLGALFFSHLIYNTIKEEKLNDKQLVKKGTKVGLTGGILLAIIYSGFAVVSAIYSKEIFNVADENLFATLTLKILGPAGSILANTAVAVATLTTAMSLVTIFSDYLCFDILKGKMSYTMALIFTIAITVVLENLKFSGLMKIIQPLALIIYPSLITLSIACILKKSFNFKYIKTVTFATFAVTCLGYLFFYVI